MPVSSSDTAKPSGVFRAISPAPMFEVMITIAWRKSTVRPCESVRRPSEPGHGVLLHVLRHVDAHHRVLVAEQELGERPGQLRLAHARRAQEDEGAGRALGGLE